MPGFTKLFSEIVTSSIWSADDKTRIVWITMLALVSDDDGFVPASIPGLANASRVSLDDCVAAIATLEGPDQYSRTPDHDGRRIERVPGGWMILNYKRFRDRDREAKRREYMAEMMRKRRKLLAENANGMLTGANASASASVSASDIDSEEGDARGGATQITPSLAALPDWDKEWQAIREHRRRSRAPMTAHTEELVLRRLAERPAQAIDALREWQVAGWRGFSWDWYDARKTGKRSPTQTEPEWKAAARAVTRK